MARLKRLIDIISRQLLLQGRIPLGGGVYLIALDVTYLIRADATNLRITLEEPSGDFKRIEGPVYSFRGCNSSEELVLRGLQYAVEM